MSYLTHTLAEAYEEFQASALAAAHTANKRQRTLEYILNVDARDNIEPTSAYPRFALTTATWAKLGCAQTMLVMVAPAVGIG